MTLTTPSADRQISRLRPAHPRPSRAESKRPLGQAGFSVVEAAIASAILLIVSIGLPTPTPFTVVAAFMVRSFLPRSP